MSKERRKRSDSGSEHPEEREVLTSLFEDVCLRTRETFLRKGSHIPVLFVVTRLGLAVIPAEWEPDVDRAAIARGIRETICRTAIKADDEPVYDEPMAVILAAEAWMVELQEDESRPQDYLPPRLHPDRKEILQVTLRSRTVSFSRQWPIVRDGKSVTLGPPSDLGPEGMTSVWDIIFTG